MKKIIALVLVIALCCTISVGLTVAYLTDRESEANVFTVGDVSIRLDEEFENGATLIPGVDIEKEPTITNTGKNDAYVWANIAIPAAFDKDDASKNVIHFNYSKESVADGLWTWTDNGSWLLQKDVDIDGIMYNVYTVLYQTALKPGQTTEEPVMTKVYMDPHVDITPEGDVYHVENGVAEDLDWNVNEYGNPIIYVSAYAMQTVGLEDLNGDNEITVMDAYMAYNKQWTTDAGVNTGLEWGAAATVVAGADDLVSDVNKDGGVVMENDIVVDADTSAAHSGYGDTGITLSGGTLDGAGNTLTVENSNGSWDSAVNAEAGTIKNLTVNGAFRGIFMGGATGDVYIDNVTIDDVCYTFNSDAGNKEYGVYISNSTLNGWTSYSDVHKEVVFTNCNFGQGTGSYTYAFCRPYNASVFENCVFEEGFEFDTSKTSDIVFINCYYGDTLITAANAETLAKDEVIFFYKGLNGITIK